MAITAMLAARAAAAVVPKTAWGAPHRQRAAKVAMAAMGWEVVVVEPLGAPVTMAKTRTGKQAGSAVALQGAVAATRRALGCQAAVEEEVPPASKAPLAVALTSRLFLRVKTTGRTSNT